MIVIRHVCLIGWTFWSYLFGQCLVLLVTHAQQSNGSSTSLVVFPLPPFALTLYSNHDNIDTNLASTASSLQSIIQSYLYDFFYASAIQSPQTLPLHVVEVHVALQEIDAFRLWAEVYGNVAFLDLPSDETSKDSIDNSAEMQKLLINWIHKAFDPDSSLGLVRQRIVSQGSNDLVLSHLETLQISFDILSGPPAPIHLIPEQENQSDQWSTLEIALLITLIVFVLASVTTFYIFIYVDRQRYRIDHEMDHLHHEGTVMPTSEQTQIVDYDPYETYSMEHKNSWLQQWKNLIHPESNQELPFVYMDFPRHDGTPCLIYNPKEDFEESLVVDEQNVMAQPDAPFSFESTISIDMSHVITVNESEDLTPLSSDSAHSDSRTVSSTNSLEQFLKRLEKLYQFKHRQYQQRAAMAKERIKRRHIQHQLRPLPTQTPTVTTTQLSLALPTLKQNQLNVHDSDVNLIVDTQVKTPRKYDNEMDPVLDALNVLVSTPTHDRGYSIVVTPDSSIYEEKKSEESEFDSATLGIV
jgi:hypothetical protein